LNSRKNINIETQKYEEKEKEVDHIIHKRKILINKEKRDLKFDPYYLQILTFVVK